MLDATNTTQQRQASQTEAWATTLSDLIDGNRRALTQWLQGTQAFSSAVKARNTGSSPSTSDADLSFLPLRSCLQTAPAARAEQRFAAEIARDSLTGGTLSFERLRRRRAAFALRVVWASFRSGRNRDRRSG